MKKALVVSGGGCKGAYAVGVLEFLKESRPEFFAGGQFTFEQYFGTSTGALIVPLASTSDLDLLRAFYTGTTTGELLVMHNGLALLQKGHLFDSTGLDTLIDTVFNPVRFGLITDPALLVGLTGVCLQTGELRLFTSRPLPANPPHYNTQTIASRDDLVDAIRASAHQPFFMRPIRFRSAPAVPPRHYVDGGVREYAAIQVALDAGADEILAILLTPETHETDDSIKPSDLIGVLQRTIDIFSEDVNLNDVRVPDLRSRGTNYWLAVQAQMQAAGLPAAQIAALLNPPGAPNPFPGGKVTRIHIIRPTTPLGGGPGGLRFDPVEMRGMFARGKAEAKQYFDQLDANGGVPPTILA